MRKTKIYRYLCTHINNNILFYFSIFFLLNIIILIPFSKSILAAYPPVVRVLVQEARKNISITSEGRIKLTTDKGKSLGTFMPDEYRPLKISPLSTGISVNGETTDSSMLVISSIDRMPIKIGNFSYRGEIVLHLNNNWKIEVINRLDMEDYLKGIMKAEISPGWPVECLKAQAVVARTYSLYQMEGNSNKGMYDLKATTESQVYKGITGEDPRSNLAVNETRGLVLVTDTGYLPSLYHACCGGHTENSKYVFYDHPSLIGVPCNYCNDSPHFEWEAAISKVKIRNLFLRQYYRMGPIEDIVVIKRTPNGRIETLQIIHTLGDDIINGKQLRALVGNDIIRSTLFSIIIDNDTLIFQGKGWGHGVGLCQWGAKSMAEKGMAFKDILRHYYPLARLDNAY